MSSKPTTDRSLGDTNLFYVALTYHSDGREIVGAHHSLRLLRLRQQYIQRDHSSLNAMIGFDDRISCQIQDFLLMTSLRDMHKVLRRSPIVSLVGDARRRALN
jgi:hypothetical protein